MYRSIKYVTSQVHLETNLLHWEEAIVSAARTFWLWFVCHNKLNLTFWAFS